MELSVVGNGMEKSCLLFRETSVSLELGQPASPVPSWPCATWGACP